MSAEVFSLALFWRTAVREKLLLWLSGHRWWPVWNPEQFPYLLSFWHQQTGRTFCIVFGFFPGSREHSDEDQAAAVSGTAQQRPAEHGEGSWECFLKLRSEFSFTSLSYLRCTIFSEARKKWCTEFAYFTWITSTWKEQSTIIYTLFKSTPSQYQMPSVKWNDLLILCIHQNTHLRI